MLPRLRAHAQAHGPALAVLAIGALVYWSRILIDPAGRVAGGRGDPLFIAYIVSWVATHIGDAALWNPPFFHPATNVLAYSDHLLGLGVTAWPLVAAGASPVLVVNLLAILASVLTSLAVYFWLRGSGVGGAAAGATALIVTYSAWRHLQISHLQLQWLAFLPLALLCYGRAIEGARLAWLWAGGGALALQTLFTPSLGVLMMPLAAVWLMAASALARRTSPAYWAAAAGSLAVVGLVNLPVATHYWQLGAALDRTVAEVQPFSATWIDWVSAQRHWLYGTVLRFSRGYERELFAGFGWLTVAALGVAGALAGRRPLPMAALLTAALALWATTGLTFEGFSWARLPYEIFHRLAPGGGQVRVPARFVLVAGVFLAPVLAVGWTSIQHALARRVPARTASWLVLVLAGVVVAEALPAVAWYENVDELAARQPRLRRSSGAVLMVPLAEAAGPRREIARMWSARLEGVPLVNGYSGHESALYRRVGELQADRPDRAALGGLYALLRRYGVTTIAVDESPSPSASPLIDRSTLVEEAPGVFRIPDAVTQVRVDRFEMGRGAALMLTESGWSYPERNDTESWVWSVQPRATLQVPLGGVPRRQISVRARSQSESDELELWWNGRRLGAQPLGGSPMLHTFRLPEEALATDWIDLEVRGPTPVRAAGNPDPRRLSVCVFEIRLE
jgi:hypothetical protein